ncbi:MAG TPA: hypothetical protein VM639_00925 [Dongiaceae bacterium]|nr:hypothetical protein [Dongiaceae bacterium]
MTPDRDPADAPHDAHGAILGQARSFASAGDDAAAKRAYLDILQRDPTHFDALNELAALALAGGYRTAARSAYQQAVQLHPANPVGRVNLANLLLDEGDAAGAKTHLQAALGGDDDLAAAHQGLARAFTALGDTAAAEPHWHRGFAGQPPVKRPYRGRGTAINLLLLVAARGGNIPTQHWIDDRSFAVTALYCDFCDPAQPLPPHDLVVNAIGDADFCVPALAGAGQVLARSAAPVINPPALVAGTGRAAIARRLAGIGGVIAPTIREISPATLVAAEDLRFPLLLRKPGYHTGRHFHFIADRAALAPAIAALPEGDLLAIEYLDARGADGMARKYRVVFIDGAIHPVHLAISADWKVHYFTADMAGNAAHRAEEGLFLDDMAAVLGARAMTALAAIRDTIGLDYAGIDFALARDGSLLLFEANATMVIYPPEPDPIWDYRRAAIGRALDAARQMVIRRAQGSRRAGR